jgi:hypothetical protein
MPAENYFADVPCEGRVFDRMQHADPRSTVFAPGLPPLRPMTIVTPCAAAQRGWNRL